ncbi:hypothetical protein, partial [Frateuria sp. Soil773]|uniref:hypothetical protein n=1 Tax=Frateuria sp. Soil773 TaxID=1736407 RepID=UPI001F3795DD
MLYSWQTWNFQQWGVMTRTAIPIDQAKFLAANFLNARSSRKRRTLRRLLILSALWLRSLPLTRRHLKGEHLAVLAD